MLLRLLALGACVGATAIQERQPEPSSPTDQFSHGAFRSEVHYVQDAALQQANFTPPLTTDGTPQYWVYYHNNAAGPAKESELNADQSFWFRGAPDNKTLWTQGLLDQHSVIGYGHAGFLAFPARPPGSTDDVIPAVPSGTDVYYQIDDEDKLVLANGNPLGFSRVCQNHYPGEPTWIFHDIFPPRASDATNQCISIDLKLVTV